MTHEEKSNQPAAPPAPKLVPPDPETAGKIVDLFDALRESLRGKRGGK